MRSLLAIALFSSLAGCAVESAASSQPSAADEKQLHQRTPSIVDVELDLLTGIGLDARELADSLEISRQAFASVGIDVRFMVRSEAISAPPMLTSRAEKSSILASTRDSRTAVHVVLAARGAGAHGIVHYSRATDSRAAVPAAAALDKAGVILFAATIADAFTANPALADAGLTLSQLVGRTLTHELGHALGCPHSTGERATVMMQNSSIGPVSRISLPRWRFALAGDGVGHPVFADEARSCLTPNTQLSVELARPSFTNHQSEDD